MSARSCGKRKDAAAHPLAGRSRGAARPRQLRFATAEEVAAPARRRRGRQRQEAYRLAYDLLAREATGRDVYHGPPPLPHPWLRLPFAQWLRRAGDDHELQLPARFDAAKAERHGNERAHTARALGLARTPLRRALEMWLVLDRALWFVRSRLPRPRRAAVPARRLPAQPAHQRQCVGISASSVFTRP